MSPTALIAGITDRFFAVVGILFNDGSEPRGYEFVTRKISRTVARINAGLADRLPLGNLEARRDWGYAPEYVEAMWRMMQQDEPDDYVIATGESHSVREFAEKTFAVVGLDWGKYVEVDQRLYRPTEIRELRGDASKARGKLGWAPAVDFEAIVERMVRSDVEGLANPAGAR